MYTVDKYTLVKNIDELVKRSYRNSGNDIYVDALGLFRDARKVTYPHVFKRQAPFDFLSPAGYYPCENDEMLQAVRSKIDALQFDINYYKEVLNAFIPCEKENNHD